MNFESLKNSYFSELYTLKNNTFCIFESKNLDIDLELLCHEAESLVPSGFLFQTSGTSGEEKFVLHDFNSLKSSAQSISKHMGWSDQDLFICPLSVFHMGGFSILFRAFILGAPPPFIIDWDPKTFLLSLKCFLKKFSSASISKSSHSYRGVHLSLVPQQVYDIIQNHLLCPSEVHSVFVGGSNLSDEFHQQALSLGWPIHKTFGSTEAGSQIFTQKKSGKDINMELLNHWQEVHTSYCGVLSLKGPSLFKAYLKYKKGRIWKEPIFLNSQGFFETEDHVEVAQVSSGKKLNKWVFRSFVARKNDVVKINSYLCNVNEVREEFFHFIKKHFLKSDMISEFHLMPVPDQKSGHHLVLISKKEWLSKDLGFKVKKRHLCSEGEEEPKALLYKAVCLWNKNQKSYKIIRGIYYLESIPQSFMGKIQMSELKKSLF